jgi:outer membrane protein assembly factor BamB
MMFSPSVVDGVVYIGASNGPLYAIDAATGATLWSFANGYSLNTAPVVVNGVLIVGSTDGLVYAFDLAGGLNPNAAQRVDPKSLHPNLTLKVSG